MESATETRQRVLPHASHLAEADFEAAVLRPGRPALVDFYADWCGPCRALAPQLDALAAEVPGGVFKVNIEESPALADRFGVSSIPTVLLFDGGREVKRLVGPSPARLAREVRESLAG